MVDKSCILGVILAGGGSRRMFAGAGAGNGDKGLLDLAGRPMIAHVIDRARHQVGHLILNANGDPTRFDRFGLPVVPDLQNVRLGPLAGFAAALVWAEHNLPQTRALVTLSADLPFLPLDFAERLVASGHGRAAIACSDGQRHSTMGLWPVTLKEEIFAALQQGARRVDTFARQHEAIEVSFPFSDIGGRMVDPFFNANTPEDLAAARALLSS